MKHPNQSFIDGFFRNNKSERNNSYYYSKEFLEEQRKKKFDAFLQENLSPNKKASSKHLDSVLNLLGYNTLSKNLNKQEYITEDKIAAKNLPKQFVYNGLLYSFNEKLNVFVNQHGHEISIEQATAFMQMVLLEEVEIAEMDASVDGGYQTASVVVPEIQFFSFDEPRPEIGPKQPNWFRNAAFNASTGIGMELYRNIVGANLGNTAETIPETPIYNLNGILESENTISYSGNNAYLRRQRATEEESVVASYNEFVNPFGSTGSVAALKKYDPDMAGLDANIYGPLYWRSKIVPLNGTTAEAYSVILKRYPNINFIEPLVEAHHQQGIKCWAYLKPLFNYLNLTDYPPAKTITNTNTPYVSTKLARSIFNENYKNYLKDIMVELVTPSSKGGIGFDGIYWDYSFVSDEVIDFSEGAIDVWAKSLGYTGRTDPSYISWAATNFPFPNASLPIFGVQNLYLSELVNNALFTTVQKENLIKYANALVVEYNNIILEYTNTISLASEDNAIFLPSVERNSWFIRKEISVNPIYTKYSNSVKSELLVEPVGYHRQRERKDFYPVLLGETSGSEKLYADVNKPDVSSLLTFDQKVDYGGGNKTVLSWREPTNPAQPIKGNTNNNQYYNNFYRDYPPGWLFTISLPGEDGIVGFLRGAYQICLKNSVVAELVGFNNDGWYGEQDIAGTGDTAYYRNPVSSNKSLGFFRKACYHQKKIKNEIKNSGMTFDKRDMYAWAGVHMSNKGRQGIQSEIRYLGDFAGPLKYVRQSQMQDLFGTNSMYSNGTISTRNNDLNQNWGEFYWPIIGAMETLENYFVPYCMVHDEHLENITELNGLNVVIIPHKEWLTTTQQTNLDLFESLGGKVVYMEDVFSNQSRGTSYVPGDPRLKGRFYDLTDKPVEMSWLYNGITGIAGLPPLRGIVTKYEFEGMSFPFSNKYRNKQCSWSKYSEPDENNVFTIGAHLLNDMIWMDHRRFGANYDEMRFSELEPSSTPFRSSTTANPSATGINGIMDYDLFGWGPDWRTDWWNNIGITAYNNFYTTSGLTWPVPDPNGTTNDGDRRYFYEPHPKNMWGNPLVGGYTGGISGYWDAQLILKTGTQYEILEAKKIYVDQENEPNDLGHTEVIGFTYDSLNSEWKVNVPNIGMHAFVVLKVKKTEI